jgi:DUF4097 and DUF4098 domain-containing protein YvlB
MTSKTFPLHGPINLNARVGAGAIVVSLRDDLAVAEVSITPRLPGSDIAERITVEMSGPTLSITAPRQGGVKDLINGWGRQSRDAVDIAVTIPSGTALRVQSITAAITVEGRSGGADLSCGSAQIEVDTVEGDLRLRYGSGTSTVRRVTGSAQVRSGSGTAIFGEVVGALTAGSGSGRLEVSCARSSVRSRTGSGTAQLDAVYGDVDVASGSGELSIGLPTGVAARLDVVTGSGRVRSDLPVQDAPQRQGRSISVRARTGSGDIHVFRAA